MRVLITGITGFVGSHLAEYLLNEQSGHEVYGIKRWRSPRNNISNIEDKVTLFDGDLNDLSSLITIFDQVKPEIVFHLAAQSFVSSSYTAPADTINTNVVGTSNLLEAIRITKIDPVIHVCSSSEVYGQVDKSQIPINESTDLNPVSPYAVSKVGEDMLAYMYHQAYELKTIRSRMFTHSGPRRGEVFVDSFFALQLARIEQGQQKPVLKTGNLDSVRTFCDVRDTVKAYWMLVDKCDPGEVYNIGGNRTMTIKDMLDLLLNMSSVKNDVKVEQDPKLIRPADVTLQIPDSSKFVQATGWEPSISYEQTLQDMLDYWREEVKYGRI
ncbi:MAG: GDP-mannose 4,6-dehydratase [Chloroflexi bacterium]|nr:GDP-mannose 4,6-dehydratase [Chloroflexota bacterium]